MNTRSSTWSIVLAFGDSRTAQAPAGLDAETWFVAACLDTLDAVTATVEPSQLVVVTGDDAVAQAARTAGADVRAPGRDLNADVAAALAVWAESRHDRSALVLVGPLPYATPDTIMGALRACAATEAAVITADDGGTIALSHHDPTRLSPRFGGRSSLRHVRGHVAVGHHLDGLQRLVDPARDFPGRHLADLAGARSASGAEASNSTTSESATSGWTTKGTA